MSFLYSGVILLDNILYGRKYRVLVADDKTTALDVSNLRVVFKIEKLPSAVANYAEIKIYNLREETETGIINESTRVIVEAGYDGYYTQTINGTEFTYIANQYGVIFEGEIIQYIREKEDNVDHVLTLVCCDGNSFLSDNIISMTVNAGQNKRQIINTISQKSLIPSEIGRVSPDISSQRLPRGKVIFGEPKKYLRDIARESNGEFFIEDGRIYIQRSTDVPPGQTLVISPTSGLIGTPEQTQEGISFRTLLDPRIKLFTMIKIDNSYIQQIRQQRGQYQLILDQNGQYQAYKITHVGDSRGLEWYTEVEGVGRYGKCPAFLFDQSQAPN